MAKTDTHYVFSAEIDHIQPENNIYEHKDGTFFKSVRAMSSKLGDASLSISHSKELFDAVSLAHEGQSKCRLLLLKGTKFGTTQGGIKAAADGDFWIVKSISGSVEDGYEFEVIRTK